MGWTTEEPRLHSEQRQVSVAVLGPTEPPNQRVPAAVSTAFKCHKRKYDNYVPSRAKVKIGGAIPTLPMRIHCVQLN
jgi:hypothetical protein